jgi:hypothetical protein
MAPKERATVNSDWKGYRRKLLSHIRSEVLTAVTMKNAVFWDVAPCGSS